ncbi:MAG: flagellar hook-basal body complex protein FliE [Firmicutes bacterium]|nr:flagellar hook-basal body complex protein FliE [Alicyclobacillaceae bacterium]MCL6497286.1 flagellar hook-basal body complex protein FliE [Bacillota bacterium]
MALTLQFLPPVTLPPAPASTGGGGGHSASFGALLGQAVGRLESSQAAADQAILSALSGNTSLTTVMVAMAEAQLTLDTAVAVQNQALSSYQTIMNMPLS